MSRRSRLEPVGAGRPVKTPTRGVVAPLTDPADQALRTPSCRPAHRAKG
jgi:hypothetical protein